MKKYDAKTSWKVSVHMKRYQADDLKHLRTELE